MKHVFSVLLCQALSSAVIARFSRPVNNAGIGLVGPVESIPIEDMKKVFETNVFGVIRMIKEVMPDMKKRRGGHIIVVSSVMGLQGQQRGLSEGTEGEHGRETVER